MKNETIKTIKTVRIYEELDPCVAPDGCPELEPWMAWVGKKLIEEDFDECGCDGTAVSCGCDAYGDMHGWVDAAYNLIGYYYAIDVRTAWAQEHFPEHCRIRNYQEAPDAFEDWWGAGYGICTDKEKTHYQVCKEAYELGQANPIK